MREKIQNRNASLERPSDRWKNNSKRDLTLEIYEMDSFFCCSVFQRQDFVEVAVNL